MTDQTFYIDRAELQRVFNQRAAKAFEDMQRRVAETEETATAGVGATTTLTQATFVTLSPNTELPNEYVLSVGPGLRLETGEGGVTLYSDAPSITGGHSLAFVVTGPTSIALPLAGMLATRNNTETFTNKTLTAPKIDGLGDYANDAAAAGGGVPVGAVYRNGSVLMVRVA